MGWNGSNYLKHSSTSPKRRERKKISLKAISFSLLLITLLLVCFFLFVFNSRKNNRTEFHSTKAKSSSTTRIITENTSNKVKPISTTSVSSARPTRIGEVVNGYVKLANGRLHKVSGEITNTTSSTKAAYAIFKHPSENAIAGILSQKPGMNAIGTVRYGEAFKQNFIESLNEIIVINEDDSESIKNLKKAVIDAKQELKIAYHNGEDICKIMQEAREDLKSLARYKLQIQSQVLEYTKDQNANEQDVADFIKAANQLLSEKGIAPLKDTPFLRIKAHMDLKQTE